MTTRTFVRAGGMAMALLGGLCLPVAAQRTVEAEVTPFVGGNFFPGGATVPVVTARGGGTQTIVQDGYLRSAPTFGLSAGFRVAERFGVESTLAWTPNRVQSPSGTGPVVDASTLRYGVGVLYHMMPGARFQPFAGLGVARESTDYEPELTRSRPAEWAGSVTLGGSVPLDEGIALRLQAVQDLLRPSDSARRDQLLMTLGVSVRQPVR